MLVPVVLSGGSGTRLWPLSRELYPKQLLPLAGPRTMLQETVARLEGLAGLGAPIVVCNEAHRFMVGEQLRALGISPQALLLEPLGRNTAPAVAVAALAAGAAGHDPTLLVLPADHLIREVAAFHRAVQIAAGEAARGKLATFGIVPDRPETGYGYIRHGAADGEAFAVDRFVEKPDPETAAQYLASGEYYWNSGMFVFRASRYLAELEHHAPAIHSACEQAWRGSRRDLDFTRLGEQAFEACPSDSIDYAVMEKTRDAVVVPLEAGWSDVGSWAALYEALPADAAGNVVQGDVIAVDTRGSYLHAESRLLAAVGLEDHIVVETKDAVLVAARDRVQDVRSVVGELKRRDRYESSLHRQVYRPWGSYDSVDAGEGFQVKRLIVNPGAVLSLQMHRHRAEHWVVVSGTAKVTRDDQVFLLRENESTYIPIGTRHRIENPGTSPLQIIEVQSGSYLGEDDIVRFEDNYGRQGTNK